MATSNRDRVGKALELLREGLRPWVEQEMRATYNEKWLDHYPQANWHNGQPKFDTQALINCVIECWDDTFSFALDANRDLRDLAHALRKTRNKHAHDEAFTQDETLRALIDIQRMLEAIKAPQQAEAAEKAKMEVMRLQTDGSAQAQKKKASTAAIAGLDAPHLKPWREVVSPHQDVAAGTYQQAEFAADLWQVYKGQGSPEYRDPVEFFRRTYLTDGLVEMLSNGVKRLAGIGGDPVVELQISFGGGKTHSMLALYHLFSGAKVSDLPGVQDCLKDAPTLPAEVKRAVLVGTALRPGSPLVKDDGTVVKTLWGELAWQLGGREGFDIVRQDDESATNPGDALDALFALCGPSLILIDEWVAYARQLYNRENMLTAGDFDTQFTFAQALCEAARRAKNVLVCVSVPASTDDHGNLQPSTQVGGQAGAAALDRLKQAIGRQNLEWRAATPNESFEIVRRRLFEPIASQEQFEARDAVVAAFCAWYRKHPSEFPTECHQAEYERRMRAAYPIHPELFDRLYEDWSTLEKFQRTRGVLRLMAAVIHCLWERGDSSRLILPAMVPIDDATVQPELIRYLDDRWAPIIDKDVDGPNSTPLQLDNENSMFGRYSACRRVARTVYLGSAPTYKGAAQGIEDKRIKLGCAQPDEAVATFGDALRKLSDRTSYLYVNNNGRYWYSTQPSVNSLAKERADRLDPHVIEAEIVRRLKDHGKQRGEFAGLLVAVASSDLPDERDVRLVVLGPSHPHKPNNAASPALIEATELLKNRGTSQRLYRNTLVFMAADHQRLGDLQSAVRMYLAWKSIVDDADTVLDLTPYNKQQAASKVSEANKTSDQRIHEAYYWVLAPKQPASTTDPEVIAAWDELRAQGTDPLAARAAKKLRNEDALITQFGGNMLAREINQVPLWRGNHVAVRQLEDDFAQYLYLPRLKDVKVLHASIRDGVGQVMTWQTETFGYADGVDEEAGSYIGLKAGVLLDPYKALHGYLVKPDVAAAQLAAAAKKQEDPPSATEVEGSDGAPAAGGGTSPAGVREEKGEGGFDFGPPVVGGTTQPNASAKPQARTRFHGQVQIPATQLATTAQKVSAEVLQHLISTLGSEAEITLEIHVKNPSGFSETTIRTVTENCRTLKFKDGAFEED